MKQHPLYALAFDGIDDYVAIPNSNTLNLGNNGTISFWIKFTKGTANYWYDLISKAKWAQSGYCIIIEQTGGHAGISLDSSIWEPADTITPGVWHHIVFTWTPTTLKYYRDGVLIASTSGTYTVTANTNTVNLGQRNNGYLGIYNLKGSFGEVLFYNRALSDTETQHNVWNPLNPVRDGLVLWLPMIEGSGTTVKDYSGNANNGTLYNGVVWRELSKYEIPAGAGL
jgi:hypothetical protein